MKHKSAEDKLTRSFKISSAPKNYRWLQFPEGQRLHLVNIVFRKTLCGQLFNAQISRRATVIPERQDRCKSCEYLAAMRWHIFDELLGTRQGQLGVWA